MSKIVFNLKYEGHDVTVTLTSYSEEILTFEIVEHPSVIDCKLVKFKVETKIHLGLESGSLFYGSFGCDLEPDVEEDFTYLEKYHPQISYYPLVEYKRKELKIFIWE